MLQHLLNGLGALGNGQAITYLFAGSLAGMIIGVIPGLGGSVLLSIVLAFIYHINLTGVLCLFLATNAGSYLSSSVAAILLNMPAHPESFAVTLDGYPMSRNGEPGRALGISASSTCIGGLIGCVMLVGFIQIINQLGTIFHPPEYVALIVLTMLLISSMGTDMLSKALISVGLGLILASVGASINGTERYTFGSLGLISGLSLVAVVLGTIALPQMVLIYGTGTAMAHQDMLGRRMTAAPPTKVDRGMARQVIQGLIEPFRYPVVLLRAAIVGTLTGLVPGIGAFTANFMSYSIAEHSSRKRRHLFGSGIPEGVIAAEGSSMSKEAGHMVPLLGLGLPGGVGGALFLAALTIKDISPGYDFVSRYPTITYEIVWIIVFGGLIGQLAAVLLAPLLARVTVIPGPVLLPIVVSLSIVGTYIATTSYFAVMEMLVFLVVGLVLRRLRYSLASFVIGLVLGGILENNIYQTHALYPGLTFLVQRPLADILFAIAIAFVALRFRFMRRQRRESRSAVTAPETVGLPVEDEVERAARDVADSSVMAGTEHAEISTRDNEFPLLEVCATWALLILGVSWFVYGITTYDFNAVLLPCVGAALIAIPSLWRVVPDTFKYVSDRRERMRLRKTGQLAAAAGRPLVGDLVTVGADRGAVRELRELDGGVLEEHSDPRGGLVGPALTGIAREPAGSTAGASSGGKDGLSAPIKHAWGRRGEFTREVVAIAWIAGAVALCFLVGFAAGIAVFCLLYGMLATRLTFPKLLPRLVFTGITAACMWGITLWIVATLHIYFTPVIRV